MKIKCFNIGIYVYNLISIRIFVIIMVTRLSVNDIKKSLGDEKYISFD